jgi:hypothetical protein
MVNDLKLLVERIQRHPMMELRQFELSAGLNSEALRQLEREYGQRLPEDVKALYAEADGCLLEWGLNPANNTSSQSELLTELKTLGLVFDGQEEPLGRLRLLPLKEVLFGDDFVALEAIGDDHIEFGESSFREADFIRLLRPFDIVDDFFSVNFVVSSDDKWKIILLSDNWIEFDHSRTIFLEDYLSIMLNLWALRMARPLLLSKYRGDREPPLTSADVDFRAILPSWLLQTP